MRESFLFWRVDRLGFKSTVLSTELHCTRSTGVMESKALSPKKVGQETPNKEEWDSIQEEDGNKTKHDRIIWSKVMQTKGENFK